jgi:hypothetical protein
MTKAKLFLAAACALMLLTVALWGTNRVSAIQPQVEYTSFGMVGVARGQTLRLNVVNALVPDRRLPPNPCKVLLTLADGAGTVLAESTETLPAGQAAALDLNGDALPGRLGNRAQVRAFIRVLDETRGNRLPPGPCVATLEVFDNSTGKTEFLHPGALYQQDLSSN